MKKKYISYILRKLNLLMLAEYGVFKLSEFKNRKTNKEFIKNNPNIPLPPKYMLFESFGMLKYDSYYINGKKSADYLIDLLAENIDNREIEVCEWGCGPSRLLRHVKDSFSRHNIQAKCYGTDYNEKTIEWCQNNIKSISFHKNNLNPPLPFEDNKFDALYSISVFTHLSKELQLDWFNECIRVLKPNGLFLFTTHGEIWTHNLLKNEKETFEKDGVYIRSQVKEGQRCYAACNSEDYVRNVLVKNATVIKYIKSDSLKKQDLWIVKKI